MSKISARNIALGGSLCIVVLGLLFFAFSWIDHHYVFTPPVERAAQAAETDRPNTLRIATALEGIRAGQESIENTELARRDLNAQEQAARWARYNAWSSSVQIILSAAGLFALIYTLRQTDKALKIAEGANKISREIGEAQTRAYLFTGKYAPIVRGTVVGLEVAIAPQVKNAGQSPARNVAIANIFLILPVGQKPKIKFDMANAKRTELGAGHDTTASRQWWPIERLEAVSKKQAAAYVFTYVEYWDIFGFPFCTWKADRLELPVGATDQIYERKFDSSNLHFTNLAPHEYNFDGDDPVKRHGHLYGDRCPSHRKRGVERVA